MGASVGNILRTVGGPVGAQAAAVFDQSGTASAINDLNKFGRDITGVTARDAANSAANAAEAAQADAEKKIKDKETIASNQEEMRRRRRMAAGGASANTQNSTILTSGLGNIGQIQNGTKTFLGT